MSQKNNKIELKKSPLINNHSKCKWTECSNQKTWSVWRIKKKHKTQQYAAVKDSLQL